MRHDADRTLSSSRSVDDLRPLLRRPDSVDAVRQRGSGSLAAAVWLADQRQRSLMASTLLLGAGVTAFAFSPSAPQSGSFLRDATLGASWLPRLVLAVPLVLPSYVLGLAWIALFGSYSSSWVYGLPASVFVLGFSLYPIVMLAMEAALRYGPRKA